MRIFNKKRNKGMKNPIKIHVSHLQFMLSSFAVLRYREQIIQKVKAKPTQIATATRPPNLFRKSTSIPQAETGYHHLIM